MIKFTCEQCNTALQIPVEYAGKEGRCTSCGARIVAPSLPASNGQSAPPPIPVNMDTKSPGSPISQRRVKSGTLIGIGVCLLFLGVVFGITIAKQGSSSDSGPQETYAPVFFPSESVDLTESADDAMGQVYLPSGDSLTVVGSDRSIPQEVMTAIRGPIEARYPNNYSMQKILIDAQVEAYGSLQRYSAPNVPKEVLAAIRGAIETRYPNNYSMQETLIDAQIEAYHALQNYQASGVPDEILGAIWQDIASRYPTDYSMQRTLLNNQVQNYLSLYGRSASGTINRQPSTVPADQAQTDVSGRIRQRAQQLWPNDYEMQQYTERNQTQAYNQLQRGNIYGIPEDVFRQIRASAQQQWPEDYEMRQYEENNEAKAYKELQRGNTYGVPPGVFQQIRASAQQQWPHDYEMQQYTEKNQVDAFQKMYGR